MQESGDISCSNTPLTELAIYHFRQQPITSNDWDMDDILTCYTYEDNTTECESNLLHRNAGDITSPAHNISSNSEGSLTTLKFHLPNDEWIPLPFTSVNQLPLPPTENENAKDQLQQKASFHVRSAPIVDDNEHFFDLFFTSNTLPQSPSV